MTRYRPPPPTSSKYVTREGEARLRAELDDLWRVQRPAVTKTVAEAAAQGDRSENAEYIYGKRKLFEIDRRLKFLGKRLEVLKMVDGEPEADGRVYFGAWVTLETEEGEHVQHRIVGPDETDLASGTVSCESPLGKALLGRELGDEVSVARPKGPTTFVIHAITFRKPQ